MISVIIPIFNERDSIPLLHRRLTDELLKLNLPFEVILVDDGSTDGSDKLLQEVSRKDERFKVVFLCRNFGQTAAMMAGIDFAKGDVLIPMDGDLQNDPADIGRLLDKLSEGFDVVSGWRKDRQDDALRRNLPSRIANRLISYISGVRLHDYGCSLKAYRRDVIKGVKLYGEMHRFVPIYASWQGARVTEIPVNHQPRLHGRSKYGLERVVKVVLDLLVVKFLARYATSCLVHDGDLFPVRRFRRPLETGARRVAHSDALAIIIRYGVLDRHHVDPDRAAGRARNADLLRVAGQVDLPGSKHTQH